MQLLLWMIDYYVQDAKENSVPDPEIKSALSNIIKMYGPNSNDKEWMSNDRGGEQDVRSYFLKHQDNNPKEKIENSYIKLNEYAEKRIFEVFNAEEKCINQCLEGIKSIRKIPSADDMKKIKAKKRKKYGKQRKAQAKTY